MTVSCRSELNLKKSRDLADVTSWVSSLAQGDDPLCEEALERLGGMLRDLVRHAE